MSFTLVVLGLAALVAGGELLVRGATGLAAAARLSATVIGLTVVAAGTSMPELVVSLQSALEGNVGIALGNVVGSNIFNIAAILGLAALVQPLRVAASTLRVEWPVMMLASLLVLPFAYDALLGRAEGAVLLVGLFAFVGASVWRSRREEPDADGAGASPRVVAVRPGRDVALVALGVALLGGGSTLLIDGAVGIASALGVSQTVIGLTIVAAGTSTPELVTSLVAARRGEDDIAIANAIGSNIFNVLGILGTTALVHPLPVPAAMLERDLWVMLALSLVLAPMLWSGRRISRPEGLLLVAALVGYFSWLVLAA